MKERKRKKKTISGDMCVCMLLIENEIEEILKDQDKCNKYSIIFFSLFLWVSACAIPIGIFFSNKTSMWTMVTRNKFIELYRNYKEKKIVSGNIKKKVCICLEFIHETVYRPVLHILKLLIMNFVFVLFLSTKATIELKFFFLYFSCSKEKTLEWWWWW